MADKQKEQERATQDAPREPHVSKEQNRNEGTGAHRDEDGVTTPEPADEA